MKHEEKDCPLCSAGYPLKVETKASQGVFSGRWVGPKVAVIGHMDRGKTALTAALAKIGAGTPPVADFSRLERRTQRALDGVPLTFTDRRKAETARRKANKKGHRR